MGKLTLKTIRALTRPGMHGDGGTLYLRVTKTGSKQWVQRLMVRGKVRDLGLGGYALVSLADARVMAFDNRRLARRGGDPVSARQAASVPTFREAALETLQAECHAWKGGIDGITAAHWMRSFETHAFPAFGNRPVDSITREDMLDVLNPIWTATPEAGRKVLRRCRTVFEWADAKGLIERNPAANVIKRLLPRMPAVRAHLRALPYADVAGALRIIETSRASMAAIACLKLVILTAVRSGEARQATWAEFDLEARTWTIPGGHTKTGREHRVPLSVAAVSVLEGVRLLDDGSGLVFPSPRRIGASLSNMTLTKLLRDTGLAGGATVHGFRSSFRDWCAETGKDRATAEAALAHVVGGTEGAYFRSDLFAKRRRLMGAWAAFLSADTAEVVSLRG